MQADPWKPRGRLIWLKWQVSRSVRGLVSNKMCKTPENQYLKLSFHHDMWHSYLYTYTHKMCMRVHICVHWYTHTRNIYNFKIKVFMHFTLIYEVKKLIWILSIFFVKLVSLSYLFTPVGDEYSAPLFCYSTGQFEII